MHHAIMQYEIKLRNILISRMNKTEGTCKVRNEIKTKRNETERNEIKRNETKPNETKSNETKRKRNQTKRNETKFKKKS